MATTDRADEILAQLTDHNPKLIDGLIGAPTTGLARVVSGPGRR